MISELSTQSLAMELADLEERADPDNAGECEPLDEGEVERLADLEAFADEMGVEFEEEDIRLIEEGSFREYAEEIARDSGPTEGWPYDYINWDRAADALMTDYTTIDLDGSTYYYLAG